MLALAPYLASLADTERYALELLLDLSGVLRVEGAEETPDPRVVRLNVHEDSAAEPPLDSLSHGIVASDGEVVIRAALLREVHRIAGAMAEQSASPASRDKFGRVPTSVNVLASSSLEQRPVVSEVAQALAHAVRRAAWGRPVRFFSPWPRDARWAAALTHDLDVVEWWPAFTGLRLAELARKLEIPQLARAIGATVASGGRDVVWTGVQEVLQAEARYDARSTWFVLSGTPTFASARAGDLTYRPESPLARRVIGAARAAGHEVGLHGSFATADDPSRFNEQRARLAALTGAPVTGVRQHFLRMQPGATQAGMRAAGFEYDSTFGFSDRNGFRLGVADVLQPWHAAESRAIALDEAPFTWMDRALSKYRGIEDPDIWIDDALALAERCRAVQGLFVGIWHPNLTAALGYPGAAAAYARLVKEVTVRGAWTAPLGEIVEWRRARRAARAQLVNGSLALVTSDPRIALEDARGRRAGLPTNA